MLCLWKSEDAYENTLFRPMWSSEQGGIIWSLSSDKLTDLSAGAAYYINDAAELVTVPAQEPLIVNGELLQLGSWKEFCTNPLNPLSWNINSATRSFFKTIGSFNGYTITDNGATWNGLFLYESAVSGNPAGKQTVSILYDIGTSGTGWVSLRNLSLTESRVIYSNGTWSVASTASGMVTIKSDTELLPGLRRLILEITWTNPTNTLRILIGPGSTTGKNIIVYGATVNEVGNIWPLFNQTGGSTLLSRAGVTSCVMNSKASNYKLFEVLNGKVYGDNLVPNGDFSQGGTGWTLDSGWSIVNGELIGAANGTTSVAANTNVSSLTIGGWYELSFEIAENTLNGNGLGFSSGDSLHPASVYYTTTGMFHERLIADNNLVNTLRVFMYLNSTSGAVRLKNFSIRAVQQAQAKITFDWTPRYASSIATVNQTIFKAGTLEILYHSLSGNITINDGTTTSVLNLTSWSSGDLLKFKILYGTNHPTYPGVGKKQICVSKDGGATWTNSSVTAFDGSLINAGDTALTFGDDSRPWGIKNFKAYTIKSGDWPI